MYKMSGVFAVSSVILVLANICILLQYIALQDIYTLLPYFVAEMVAICAIYLLFARADKYTKLDSTKINDRARTKGLKPKQNQMLLLAQNVSDGVILLDREGRILLSNKRARDYFGNIAGIANINEIGDRAFLQKILLYLDTLKKDDKARLEKILIENRECEVLFCPMRGNARKKFRGIAIILRDISATSAMQNMRREFSANVTHELKTPLTSIIASSEMIANDLVKKEDISAFAARIEGEARHLLSMIDEVLRLSFLDENSDITKGKIDLKNIIDSVINRIYIIAKDRKIHITSRLESASILGNEALLENLIYNLCDNAIKYNKKNGSVKITLQSKCNKAIFRIKDSGIGIPKAAQDRIFERFYCVDKSRSKILGGSGLGLSIVKSVARYHQANIALKSKENKGSEFIITFPLCDGDMCEKICEEK